MSVPAAFLMNQQIIRSIPNPIDKSTVVSIFPYSFISKKETLSPPEFPVIGGTLENPGITIVGMAFWYRMIDLDQPFLEIPVTSPVLAESIVRDFANGLPYCDMGGRMPGLFSLPGAHSVKDIKEKHSAKLLEYHARQKNWYQEMVKQADSLFARSNGNILAISELDKLAAKELGITDKAWLKDIQHAQLIPCVACGSMRNPAFPICSVCQRVIDVKLYESLGLGAVAK